MKTNIVSTASGKANAYALFFVKKSVQFSNVLSESAEKQVESVLNGMEEGPFEDLEFLEIDNQPTIFVNAAKERGLSSLDHLRMAAYRLAKKASKRQIPVVSIMLADAAPEQFQIHPVMHDLCAGDDLRRGKGAVLQIRHDAFRDGLRRALLRRHTVDRAVVPIRHAI